MLRIHKAFKTFNKPQNEAFVSLGDHQYQLPILGSGQTPLLDDALYVPNLSINLISVGQLDNSKHTSVFQKGKVKIYKPNGELLLTGTKYKNLYYLDQPYIDLLFNDIPIPPLPPPLIPSFDESANPTTTTRSGMIINPISPNTKQNKTIQAKPIIICHIV